MLSTGDGGINTGSGNFDTSTVLCNWGHKIYSHCSWQSDQTWGPCTWYNKNKTKDEDMDDKDKMKEHWAQCMLGNGTFGSCNWVNGSMGYCKWNVAGAMVTKWSVCEWGRGMTSVCHMKNGRWGDCSWMRTPGRGGDMDDDDDDDDDDMDGRIGNDLYKEGMDDHNMDMMMSDGQGQRKKQWGDCSFSTGLWGYCSWGQYGMEDCHLGEQMEYGNVLHKYCIFDDGSVTGCQMIDGTWKNCTDFEMDEEEELIPRSTDVVTGVAGPEWAMCLVTNGSWGFCSVDRANGQGSCKWGELDKKGEVDHFEYNRVN